MKQILKNWFCILFLAISLFLITGPYANASTLTAPTVLKINTYTSYAISAPVISGVVSKDANVLVYIDNVFAGNAKTQKSNSKTNSFYFQAFGLSEGMHKVYLIAEDEKSLERSDSSKIFEIIIEEIKAPTLVVPNEKTITGKVKPVIEGLTKSGTFVHLYIDGKYNGKTKIVENVSGTANFAYTPFLNLSVGRHKMWAVSEDLKGRKSKASKVIEFDIEQKMPAPTIFYPKVKNYINDVVLTGLSKNDSKINVFVDHKFDGSFVVKNHKSGTANFAYKLKSKLSVGKHYVYVTAVDKRGKESIWSNIIYFGNTPVTKPLVKATTKPVASAISEEGASEEVKESKEETKTEETKETAEKLDANIKRVEDYLVFSDLYKKDDKLRLNDEQYKELEALLKSEVKIGDERRKDLEDLLATRDKKSEEKKEDLKEDEKKSEELASSTNSNGGPIDEKKKSQGSIGWNALIFILFLMAVIAWIFWVNRELIKEKKEQEEKEKEEKNK